MDVIAIRGWGCRLPLLFVLLACWLPAQGQQLVGLASRWSNEFTEWEIQTSDNENAGEIRMQWTMQNNWTDWSIQLGGETGRLRIKWKDNLNEWELRMGREIITIRTAWRDRFQEWIVISDEARFTIRPVYGNTLEAWETINQGGNYLGLYTSFEGDPRAWTIVDDMGEEISIYTKLALAFMPIIHSVPRN